MSDSINKTIRTNFPAEGNGSDGWVYKTAFSGETLHEAYDLLKDFLVKQGYKDVPIPRSLVELMFFLDEEINSEYRHNPISIHPSAYNDNELWLSLYNENFPNHLLMFHDIIDYEDMKREKESEADRAIEFIQDYYKNHKNKKFETSDLNIVELKAFKSKLVELNYSLTSIISGILYKPYIIGVIEGDDIKKNFGEDVLVAVLDQSHHIF